MRGGQPIPQGGKDAPMSRVLWLIHEMGIGGKVTVETV